MCFSIKMQNRTYLHREIHPLFELEFVRLAFFSFIQEIVTYIYITLSICRPQLQSDGSRLFREFMTDKRRRDAL